ncbi:MAG: hypothetical protein ABIS50_10025 [Luteolibacter sp.]|uniref:RCC1 domain-containing protein n=1 Tax=Luteolibacter sp. TaxID=1962973 RepID=UPI003262DD8B
MLSVSPSAFACISRSPFTNLDGALANKKVASLSAGQYHTLALCADGTLVSWGYNEHGELGNNTVTPSKTPINIGSFGALAGKTVSAVASGGSHSLALCTDGTLATWGANNKSQLGLIGISRSLVPVAVPSAGAIQGKTILGIAAGGNHNLVLCTDRSAAAWGDNSNGQLGNNTTATSEVSSSVDSTAWPTGSRCMLAATGSASLHSLAMVGLPSPSTSSTVQSISIPADASLYLPPLDDPDHDGIPNLVERAFALDPANDSSGKLPVPLRIGDNYVLEFTEPESLTSVTYGAESSVDLKPGSWREVKDTGSGSHHIFSVPTADSNTIFFRLKVSE